MSRIEQALMGGGGFNEGRGTARPWSESVVAAAALIFFLTAWTVHGAIAEADKSLHYDLLEAYAWGQEFQLGYNQHGPFWAWIAGAWFYYFPTTNASFILLEALNATLGLLGAWKLNGLFAKGPVRHAATLLLLATPFYTFMAYKYNANTIFISLWPWTLYFFIKSLDDMRIRDAILFGAFAAFCILSKYYTVILLMTCALSLLFHPRGREYVLSALPWAAAAVFTALVLPHFLWALRSDAPPVAYAMGLTGKGWLFTLNYAGQFLTSMVIYNGGILALIALAWRMSKAVPVSERAAHLSPSRRRFLTVLVLAPPLLTVMFGLIFQLKILLIMSVGIFPLVPLFLMQFFAPLDSQRLFRMAGAVAAAVTLIAAAGAPFERGAMARKAGSSFVEPRRELAARVTELWHAETGTKLRYAAGAAPYVNGIAFYSEDHPSSLIAVSYAKSLWVKPADISKHGLLIACEKSEEECTNKAQAFLTENAKTVSISIARKIGTRQMREYSFDIYIIPPQSR
jgi:hypothetical protein